MYNGGDGNALFYCPKCGEVLHSEGNNYNQKQPEWKTVSRINERKLIAAHIMEGDAEILPNFISDYVNVLGDINKLSAKDISELKAYAKLGCLVRLER